MRWLVLLLLLFGAVGQSVTAQAQLPGADGADEETVLLTIRLRDSDGRFVTEEPVSLSRLPEEETAVVCTTDAQGECAWPVTRGLYQLLFARPLDGVNAVLLGEGGLRGLGVTVGEAPITYHFTFHSDDHVYFDLAPEMPLPLPKIPSADLIHHHGEFGEEDHAHDEGEMELELERELERELELEEEAGGQAEDDRTIGPFLLQLCAAFAGLVTGALLAFRRRGWAAFQLPRHPRGMTRRKNNGRSRPGARSGGKR